MSIRVGRLKRHEDVHGISGTGDPAEIVEFSDGSVVVRWLGKDAMTNVAAGIKNVLNVHGHGGKSEVEWIWEQEPAPDPMEAVFDKKIAAAGATGVSPLGVSATSQRAEPGTEAEADDAEAEALANEIVGRVTTKVVEKLAARKTEKLEENDAEEPS